MKEGVTDISDMLDFLHGEIKSMKETIDSQHAEMCRLNRVNGRLQKENKELRKKLSKYEKPKKNSSNSSTPPTKEPIKSEVIRRTNSLREKSNRPIGGQLGHVGKTRTKVSNPDVITDHVSHYCTKCGADISNTEAVLKYTTQEVDIPVIKPIITEHRHYSKVCECGCNNLSHSPIKKGGNSVVFGKNIQALSVYLNVVQCVPYERLQSLLEAVFNVKMSQGTIYNLIQETNQKTAPALELIKQHIFKSKVVGFDESGCYCNGRLDWSWIAQTPCSTLVFRANGRGGKVLEEQFGDNLKNITAVTDRHSAYFSLPFNNHQICMAHILREIQYLNELDSSQSWSKELGALIRGAIHERKENPTLIINTKTWLGRLDKLLKQNLENLKVEFGRLKKGLMKYRDYVFNFLENPAIPPDNNASERGIRKLKIKQKISGVFRSDLGADAFMSVHSIADTAWKNNQSPFNAILALLEC